MHIARYFPQRETVANYTPVHAVWKYLFHLILIEYFQIKLTWYFVRKKVVICFYLLFFGLQEEEGRTLSIPGGRKNGNADRRVWGWDTSVLVFPKFPQKKGDSLIDLEELWEKILLNLQCGTWRRDCFVEYLGTKPIGLTISGKKWKWHRRKAYYNSYIAHGEPCG